ASCSGFNLLLIAAYSYIVNPDLYGQAALPGIPASRRRKAPPGSFSSAHRLCISKIAPNQRPAFARQRPLTDVHRPCRRLAVDVGGGSESDHLGHRWRGGLQCTRSADASDFAAATLSRSVSPGRARDSENAIYRT